MLAHFRAAFGGVIEQHLVEVGPRDLIRMIGLGAKGVLEIKFGPLLGTGAKHFAPEFFHEPGAQKFFVQLEAGKRLHTKR